jgi:DNA-binding MarR family transcriptional regulator
MFFSQSIWRTREAFSTVGRIIQLSGSSLRAGLRYIDLLEEEGLVKRERGPQDRRILHLLLSERGRESVEQVLSFALERHAL